jgi:chromate reductase
MNSGEKEMNIAIIVGSIRRDSFNKKLAEALITLAPASLTFKHIRIDDLPLYNQDNDEHQSEPVLRLKKEIESADALLFVTPEYNRSIPGVLKNALDQGSRPYGKNAWGGKRAGVIGISPGNIGTALAQQHLRNILAYLDVDVLCQPEAFLQMKEGFFDDKGNIGPASIQFLQKWMDKYVAWVKPL